MKNKLWLAFVILIVTALAFTGYTQAAPTAAPVTIKLSLLTAPSSWSYTYFEDFAKDVKEKSGGRLLVDLYAPGKLVKGAEHLTAVSKGVADMAQIVSSYTPGMMPFNDFWQGPKVSDKSEICTQLFFDTLKYMEPESTKLGIHFSGGYIGGATTIITKKKAIRVPADAKGLKLRVNNDTNGNIVASLKALPVNMSWSEVYENMGKGVIDGALGPADSIIGSKLWEVSQPGYFHDIGTLAAGMLTLSVNLDLYKRLSPDLQKILDDAAYRLSMNIAKKTDELGTQTVQTLKKQGVINIVWSDSDKAKLSSIVAVYYDDWAKAMDAKGYKGSEMLAAVRSLLKK